MSRDTSNDDATKSVGGLGQKLFIRMASQSTAEVCTSSSKDTGVDDARLVG